MALDLELTPDHVFLNMFLHKKKTGPSGHKIPEH